SFRDCGQGRVVFEVKEPSDYKVGADGVLYATRRLRLAPGERAPPLVAVYARDTLSKQVWKMHVRFIVQETGAEEVLKTAGDATLSRRVPEIRFPWRSAVVGGDGSVVRRVKRDWVIPPINVPENSRGQFPEELV
ncbi:hypothetical protein CRUP_031710, partial [Coryphaenoides rupestris]